MADIGSRALDRRAKVVRRPPVICPPDGLGRDGGFQGGADYRADGVEDLYKGESSRAKGRDLGWAGGKGRKLGGGRPRCQEGTLVRILCFCCFVFVFLGLGAIETLDS